MGDEYWFVPKIPGSCLVRKPFPAFEEVPPKKLVTLGYVPPKEFWRFLSACYPETYGIERAFDYGVLSF